VEAIVQAMGGHRGSQGVQREGCAALLLCASMLSLGRSNRDIDRPVIILAETKSNRDMLQRINRDILQRIKSAGAEEAVQRAIASPDASESTKNQGQELLSLLR
jgi:hypothetical protein